MKDWIPSKRTVGRVAIAMVVASGLLCVSTPYSAKAESLEGLLPYVIENHDRVRAAKSRLTAARNRAREALGAWYPTLGQTANAGHETQENDNGDDSRTGFHEWDISLTQLLWDFGSTNAAIDKARLQVEEARYSLIETRQALILEAITAYMNVIRSDAALGFAKESEENIRRQTGLEEALVELGSGFSTDVLQVKRQLAGTQARRAQSEGGLTNALNRFLAVYGRMPDDLKALERVPFPASFLPQTLTQATDIAFESNPTLKNAILASDIAVEDVRIARADNFTPKIEASGERKFKKNVGGTIGAEQETLAKVEMTFDFNLGFTAVNTLRASENDLSATTFTAADTRRNIEEQVRNSWQQLETAKHTASHLNNQANIAAAFLELARNERQLGRRTLLEVLTGETDLINAKSDAFSAETDVLIAAYGLLAATGQLEYDVIKQSKGIEAPKFPLPSSAPAAETPSPAPTLPVTPATGQQNGEIEPDVTVTEGRSVNDMHALLKKVEGPDVAALPDIEFTYGTSQSGTPVALPNHPPKPKSRYDSFADFDAQADTFTTQPDEVDEFASSDGNFHVLDDTQTTLPADSDTEAAVTADESGQSHEVADAQPAAPVDNAIANKSGSFLTDLFSFLSDAHKASLDDDPVTQPAQTSVTMDMPQMQIPEPDAMIEVSEVRAPIGATEDSIAATDGDPITKFFGDVFSFLENSQSTAMPVEEISSIADATTVAGTDPAAAMPSNELASLPDAATSDADIETPQKQVPQGIGSLLDLFNFLEAAHQRALDDATPVDEQTDEVSAQPEPVADAAPEPAASDDAQGESKSDDVPALFALLDNLLGSGGTILGDIKYEPGTVDSLGLSDR